MKDWVKPFLVREAIESYIESGYEENFARALAEERIVPDLEIEGAVYENLLSYFNINFGFGGLSGAAGTFRDLFGSVLANLPEEVFLALSEKKNLFFTFTPNPGAEVKNFLLDYNIKAGEMLQIVTFPFENAYWPRDVVRGGIVHELAHVYAGHTASDDEIEEETDEIARNWGFEREISAMRNYAPVVEGKVITSGVKSDE